MKKSSKSCIINGTSIIIGCALRLSRQIGKWCFYKTVDFLKNGSISSSSRSRRFVWFCRTNLFILASFVVYWFAIGRFPTPVEYSMFGLDDSHHKSVLRLRPSDILTRRLNPSSCSSCKNRTSTTSRNDDTVRHPDTIIGVFVVLQSCEATVEIDRVQPRHHPPAHPHQSGSSPEVAAAAEEEEDPTFFLACQPSFSYEIYWMCSSEEEEEWQTSVKKEWNQASIDRILAVSDACRLRGAVAVTTWLVTTRQPRIKALNDVLIEAYFDDVTWYDVIFFPSRDPSAPPNAVVGHWPKEPRKLLENVKNVGVVVLQEPACRLYLHKNHYEIFGEFFPVQENLSTAGEVVAFLTETYSINLGESNEEIKDRKNQTRLWQSVSDHQQVLERYINVLSRMNCSVGQVRCPVRAPSSRIIAMTLYGDDPKYTLGAVRNAQLWPVVFPDWQLWFYCKRTSTPRSSSRDSSSNSSSRYSDSERQQPGCATVPAEIVRKLEDLGATMKYVDPSAGLAPMFWRFLPVDDGTVDAFISRDSDSRLSDRDAAAVTDWLRSDATFHCIRDHPSHSKYPINGGLWGARTKRLGALLGGRRLKTFMKNYADEYLQDMIFLRDELWPIVQEHTRCHDSFTCDTWLNSNPYPVERVGSEHVGQVFDAYSIPRNGDVVLLLNATTNLRCQLEAGTN